MGDPSFSSSLAGSVAWHCKLSLGELTSRDWGCFVEVIKNCLPATENRLVARKSLETVIGRAYLDAESKRERISEVAELSIDEACQLRSAAAGLLRRLLPRLTANRIYFEGFREILNTNRYLFSGWVPRALIDEPIPQQALHAQAESVTAGAAANVIVAAGLYADCTIAAAGSLSLGLRSAVANMSRLDMTWVRGAEPRKTNITISGPMGSRTWSYTVSAADKHAGLSSILCPWRMHVDQVVVTFDAEQNIGIANVTLYKLVHGEDTLYTSEVLDTLHACGSVCSDAVVTAAAELLDASPRTSVTGTAMDLAIGCAVDVFASSGSFCNLLKLARTIMQFQEPVLGLARQAVMKALRGRLQRNTAPSEDTAFRGSRLQHDVFETYVKEYRRVAKGQVDHVSVLVLMAAAALSETRDCSDIIDAPFCVELSAPCFAEFLGALQVDRAEIAPAVHGQWLMIVLELLRIHLVRLHRHFDTHGVGVDQTELGIATSGNELALTAICQQLVHMTDPSLPWHGKATALLVDFLPLWLDVALPTVMRAVYKADHAAAVPDSPSQQIWHQRAVDVLNSTDGVVVSNYLFSGRCSAGIDSIAAQVRATLSKVREVRELRSNISPSAPASLRMLHQQLRPLHLAETAVGARVSKVVGALVGMSRTPAAAEDGLVEQHPDADTSSVASLAASWELVIADALVTIGKLLQAECDASHHTSDGGTVVHDWTATPLLCFALVRLSHVLPIVKQGVILAPLARLTCNALQRCVCLFLTIGGFEPATGPDGVSTDTLWEQSVRTNRVPDVADVFAALLEVFQVTLSTLSESAPTHRQLARMDTDILDDEAAVDTQAAGTRAAAVDHVLLKSRLGLSQVLPAEDLQAMWRSLEDLEPLCWQLHDPGATDPLVRHLQHTLQAATPPTWKSALDAGIEGFGPAIAVIDKFLKISRIKARRQVRIAKIEALAGAVLYSRLRDHLPASFWQTGEFADGAPPNLEVAVVLKSAAQWLFSLRSWLYDQKQHANADSAGLGAQVVTFSDITSDLAARLTAVLMMQAQMGATVVAALADASQNDPWRQIYGAVSSTAASTQLASAGDAAQGTLQATAFEQELELTLRFLKMSNCTAAVCGTFLARSLRISHAVGNHSVAMLAVANAICVVPGPLIAPIISSLGLLTSSSELTLLWLQAHGFTPPDAKQGTSLTAKPLIMCSELHPLRRCTFDQAIAFTRSMGALLRAAAHVIGSPSRAPTAERRSFLTAPAAQTLLASVTALIHAVGYRGIEFQVQSLVKELIQMLQSTGALSAPLDLASLLAAWGTNSRFVLRAAAFMGVFRPSDVIATTGDGSSESACLARLLHDVQGLQQGQSGLAAAAAVAAQLSSADTLQVLQHVDTALSEASGAHQSFFTRWHAFMLFAEVFRRVTVRQTPPSTAGMTQSGGVGAGSSDKQGVRSQLMGKLQGKMPAFTIQRLLANFWSSELSAASDEVETLLNDGRVPDMVALAAAESRLFQCLSLIVAFSSSKQLGLLGVGPGLTQLISRATSLSHRLASIAGCTIRCARLCARYYEIMVPVACRRNSDRSSVAAKNATRDAVCCLQDLFGFIPGAVNSTLQAFMEDKPQPHQSDTGLGTWHSRLNWCAVWIQLLRSLVHSVGGPTSRDPDADGGLVGKLIVSRLLQPLQQALKHFNASCQSGAAQPSPADGDQLLWVGTFVFADFVGSQTYGSRLRAQAASQREVWRLVDDAFDVWMSTTGLVGPLLGGACYIPGVYCSSGPSKTGKQLVLGPGGVLLTRDENHARVPQEFGFSLLRQHNADPNDGAGASQSMSGSQLSLNLSGSSRGGLNSSFMRSAATFTIVDRCVAQFVQVLLNAHARQQRTFFVWLAMRAVAQVGATLTVFDELDPGALRDLFTSTSATAASTPEDQAEALGGIVPLVDTADSLANLVATKEWDELTASLQADSAPSDNRDKAQRWVDGVCVTVTDTAATTNSGFWLQEQAPLGLQGPELELRDKSTTVQEVTQRDEWTSLSRLRACVGRVDDAVLALLSEDTSPTTSVAVTLQRSIARAQRAVVVIGSKPSCVVLVDSSQPSHPQLRVATRVGELQSLSRGSYPLDATVQCGTSTSILTLESLTAVARHQSTARSTVCTAFQRAVVCTAQRTVRSLLYALRDSARSQSSIASALLTGPVAIDSTDPQMMQLFVRNCISGSAAITSGIHRSLGGSEGSMRTVTEAIRHHNAGTNTKTLPLVQSVLEGGDSNSANLRKFWLQQWSLLAKEDLQRQRGGAAAEPPSLGAMRVAKPQHMLSSAFSTRSFILPDAPQQWSCSICTYSNEASAARCEMCTAPRPEAV